MGSRVTRHLVVSAGLLACLSVAACGSGSTGGSVQSTPTAAVRTYLSGVEDVSVPDTVRAPKASEACLKLRTGAPRSDCLNRVLRSLPAKRIPAAVTRACAELSSRARGQLVSRMRTLGPEDAVELATGGSGYPPTCDDALRAFAGVGAVSLAVQGLMASKLIGSSERWAENRLTVVSSTATTARVRIGDSHMTVPLVLRAGTWQIAGLNRLGPPSASR